MTTLLSIKRAIGEVLERNGYDVYASEVQEGFTKPCCFVELAAFNSADENDYLMQISATFDILYVPSVQTHEHVIIVADELQKLFCNLPLPVGDRTFYITQTEGEIDSGNLRLSLNFNYTDSPSNPQQEQYETAERVQLNINGTKITETEV